MLSVAHAATGSFIAVKLGNPYFAVPLILASHYLLDRVPHWDTGTGLSKGLKSKRAAFAHELVDLAVTVVIVIWFFDPTLSLNSTPYWGAALALLPDFLEAPRNFLHWEPSWLVPLNRFHKAFHRSIPAVLPGLAPQFLLLAVLYLLR